MKALIGLILLFGGIALAYGGTFATFFYGVIVMVTDGFLKGIFIATLGAAAIFVVGIICSITGKAMVDH